MTVLRLDPLTDSDVEEILESDRRVSDSRGFIREARDRGIDGFLTNPQSLDMLVDVVGGGNWPASRLELFEQACRRMAHERNEEHLAAARSSGGAPVSAGGPLLEDVLAAAGRLCAIQLIAGVAGYAVTPNRENDEFPVLDRSPRKTERPTIVRLVRIAHLPRSRDARRRSRGEAAVRLVGRRPGTFGAVSSGRLRAEEDSRLAGAAPRDSEIGYGGGLAARSVRLRPCHSCP